MRRKVCTIGRISIVLLLNLATQCAMGSDRSMRCGGQLIFAGGGKDSARMYEVLKKCGEPVAIQGNTWLYFQDGMRRELTFNHESRLQRIESLRP